MTQAASVLATVLVVSTRAAKGEYQDGTGPVIYDWLIAHGYNAAKPLVVSDGDAVGLALRSVLTKYGSSAEPSVIITTGGTGISPSDQTPEQTRPLLNRELPGYMEELRRRGSLGKAKSMALLSRGLAGVSGRTLIINLPGSAGGVRDGLNLLEEFIEHAINQLRGGDHDQHLAKNNRHHVF